MESWKVLPGTHATSTSRLGSFNLLGADASEVAVPSGAIVDILDVVGDICQPDFAARIDALLDPFPLQAAEERLRHSIVPAVPFAANARLEVFGAAEAPPGIAADLRSLIGVNDGPPGPPPLDR